MKNLFVRALCLPAALLLFSCSDRNMPPSKFVGVFDVYNGHVNGKIPAGTDSYTGPWRQEYTGGRVLEGMYKDGVPTGVWVMSRPGGIPEIVETYASDNTWRKTQYFPDGQVRSVQDGRLDLEKSERKGGPFVSREAEWLGIPGFSHAWDYVWTGAARPVMADGADAAYDCELMLRRKDNSFVLWIYAYPADAKNPAPVGKHVLSGRYDVEKGEFADLKTTAKFGNYEIKVGPPDGNTMMPVELFLNGKRIANLPKMELYAKDSNAKEEK